MQGTNPFLPSSEVHILTTVLYNDWATGHPGNTGLILTVQLNFYTLKSLVRELTNDVYCLLCSQTNITCHNLDNLLLFLKAFDHYGLTWFLIRTIHAYEYFLSSFEHCMAEDVKLALLCPYHQCPYQLGSCIFSNECE